MGKTGKKILGAVVAIAAIVVTGGTAALAYVGKALVTAAISIGVSRLVAKRASTPADAGADAGARIQLPPATTNKLPIVYGTAFIGGSITDAMLSTDQKTMWYVIALAEVSDDQGAGGGSYTFDTTKCYYDGKQIQFGTNGAVTGLITNTSVPQVDTRCNGFLYVYLFNNGSSSGVNTGGLTAAQILSTTNGVPASKAWGANQTMTNCAFAIVKVIYSTDAGTTGVGGLTVNITNSITKPGDAMLDYMLNTRYGCGLPIASIDTSSLVDLNTYSDELIDYKPVGWNTGDPYQQQARYRINGPLDTGQNCLNNLQFLVDSCDSWLQYSELTGKWKVVINKKYDGYPNVSNLFLVDSSNLIGGVEVSPIDLNETFNQIEVAYPNTNIKDQTDYYIIDLFDEDPQLLSANEAINRLNVTLPLVNNAVQARYLAARRIYQSREDLVIAFRLDYSGIQLEAGDIIRVTHEVYGWTNKLFRVNNVNETKDENGNLYADIQAFEYSDAIYDDIVEDYVPSFNTGLSDPNVIGTPGTPVAALNPDDSGVVSSFTVTSAVPDEGLVLYMDFNYGNSSNVLQHRLYRTIQQSNGAPFTNSGNIGNSYQLNNANVSINDLPAGTYYWSLTARNNTSGKRSNASAPFVWPGAGINSANIIDANGVNSNGNVLTSNTAIPNLAINANVYLVSGTGQLANNTYVTGITSNATPTIFTVTPTPITPLVNASIQVITGGISGNAIIPNTLPGNRVLANTMNGNVIINGTLNGNVLISGTVNGNVMIANTLNGNTIIANTINGNTIIANTLYGNSIIANTLNGNTVIANTLNGNTITANTVNGNRIIANTLNGNTIIANTLNGNTITANTLNGNTIIANTVDGNTIIANTLNGNSIIANTIDGNTIIANTINGNSIIANTINGNKIIANTVDGNVIIANTLNGNSIIANTVNGNSIIANTLNGNIIIANTINGNSIIANTIDGNTIIANTINGNKIIGNTVNGNVIIANTLNGNSIQAFSINGGVAFIAGTIQAQAIAANTITFENLAIGAVTQSKSTISDPIVQPVPFTNIPNAWPNNTRCVVPSGGVTIIPTTDPQSSANTEYTEGSRIQISWSVKMYVEPTANNWDQYNLIEIWKSGASSVYDRGINTIRQVYDVSGNANSATYQQLAAYGFSGSGLDLTSDDGGNTWTTYNSNGTSKTITGAYSFSSTAVNAYPRTYGTQICGPFQVRDVASGPTYVGIGQRTNFYGGGDELVWVGIQPGATNNGIGFYTSPTSNLTTGYQSNFLSLEFSPDTGGNGYPYRRSDVTGNANTSAGFILTGTNGDIFYGNSILTGLTGSGDTAGGYQPPLEKENVPNLFKDLYASYSNPTANGGITYTAVIVGQTGTVLRSERTISATDYGNSWSARSIYVQGNTSQPVLTDLYAVAGDNTDNSPATSKWVAVGQYGMIQISEDDADTWDQVYLGNSVSCDFNAVRYGNGKWVVCGDGGNIYVSSNIANANAWTQIDTGNLLYTNGANYGSIYGVYGNGNVNTNARQLNTVNYNGEWDTWSIGGQGIILYSDDNANSFQVAYELQPSETYDLTRVTYYGSYANVAQVSPAPPVEQRILNNQIFSGTILDTSYVAGQETTYYLVIGNMQGKQILAGQIFLQVQEIKR